MSAAIAERADRSAAGDEHPLARLHRGAADAVQRDRERLGERGVAQRQAVGQAQELALRDLDVVGERALEVAALADRVAAGAEARATGAAVLALAAAHRRPADDGVADLPVGHRGADRDDRARVLVAVDRVRPAPALEHEVDVRAADPAVADLEEDVVRADLGDRVLLDLDPPITLVDRGPHGLGQRFPPCPAAWPKPDTSVNLHPRSQFWRR